MLFHSLILDLDGFPLDKFFHSNGFARELFAPWLFFGLFSSCSPTKKEPNVNKYNRYYQLFSYSNLVLISLEFHGKEVSLIAKITRTFSTVNREVYTEVYTYLLVDIRVFSGLV